MGIWLREYQSENVFNAFMWVKMYVEVTTQQQQHQKQQQQTQTTDKINKNPLNVNIACEA